MSTLFLDLQRHLYAVGSDYRDFIHEVGEQQKNLEGLELSRSYGILRLGMALQFLRETGRGTLDVAILLRQVIRSYDQRLTVAAGLWHQLAKTGTEVGLRSIETTDEELLQIVADDWHPSWLPETQQIDRLQKRRNDKTAVGDGSLYAMTGGVFSQYQSQAQQIAVHANLFAEPGSTLLVMLPTGSGKSLAAQLPAWLAANSGGGTTLVVVPTVALALDQEQKALRFFESKAPSEEYLPHSWTGQTSPETREMILRGIRYGTLPILYTSPEALMQYALYNTCLQAAEQGRMNRFVIDEAHLIETWGAGFRTDFQFLATYREKLMTRAKGMLRTLLLSATVSPACALLLKQLFGRGSRFYEIHANRLRPEPGYWFSFSKSASTRERRVLEALHYLPRPLVLYVSTIKDAEDWERLLLHRGFQRSAIFTGDTDDNERLRLVKAWNDSEIDVMVATSAFGLGVDKSDVRSIVHACLPESIDRFYQEVGRSGRDGYSSVSLLCTTIDDYQIAESMISDARITTERAIARWEGMRKTLDFPDPERHDLVQVDTNAPPDGSPDMHRSKANRGWNEHTLLLMQRAALIRIADTHENSVRDADVESNDSLTIQADRLKIQLLKPTITSYPGNKQFRALLETVRDQERQQVEADLKKMMQVVRAYTGEEMDSCLALQLSTLYSQCTLACGGCPYCRAQGVNPYEQPLVAEIEIEPGKLNTAYLHGELKLLLGGKAVMNVTWEGMECDASIMAQLKVLLAGLTWAGIQQLLLPDDVLSDAHWERALIQSISRSRPVPHQILSHSEVCEGTPLYTVPTVIVYPHLDDEADFFYRRIKSTIKQWNVQRVPTIHVVRRFLFLESESGYFMDRIDGKMEMLGRLQGLLAQWQEPVLF